MVASTGPGAEEAHARLAAVEAALERLDELGRRVPRPPRADRPAASDATTTRRATSGRTRTARATRRSRSALDHLEIRTAVLDAEREAVIQLRDDGVISDEVLHSIERDLDLEALRAGV